MKKLLLLFAALLSIGVASAQTNRQHNHTFICSYYGEPINTSVMGFASCADAKNVIENIIDVIGLQPKFEIRSANIPNAAAVVQSGQRYILYNPNFIAAIDKAAGTKWASIGILAHEIGHHLNGHTITGGGSRPGIELEADEFSGFVLRKMGASLSDAQLAMKLVADQRASSTHLGKNDRLVSIANGWSKADAQLTGRVYTPQKVVTTPVPTRPVVTAPVLSERSIAYDVIFNADRTNKYYITTQSNLVKVHGGSISVLAQLKSTGREAYPWMLYASANDYFLIDRQRRILTTEGKVIGYVKKH
jgi:hypothetical protein